MTPGNLFHHNDTDGLTSGEILYRTFGRAGFDVERYSLEKPYPEVLDIVFHRYSGKIAPIIGKGREGELIEKTERVLARLKTIDM